MTSAEERFWSWVDKHGPMPAKRRLGRCWTWIGAQGKRGYGQFTVHGKTLRAHRVAFQLVRGPIPRHLELDHLCRNTSCVNPAHLDPVPHAINVARGRLGETNRERGRAQTHCRHGHAYTPENTGINTTHGRRFCKACVALAAEAKVERVRKKRHANLRAGLTVFGTKRKIRLRASVARRVG